MTIVVTVWYCYMTSINYGSKKVRDVGPTGRCHLIIIMFIPDNMFYDRMG